MQPLTARFNQFNHWHKTPSTAAIPAVILWESFGTDPMFAVLPFGDEFVREDAMYFTDLELAYQEALDWSVELHGRVVYIYEQYKKDFKIITKVWA